MTAGVNLVIVTGGDKVVKSETIQGINATTTPDITQAIPVIGT